MTPPRTPRIALVALELCMGVVALFCGLILVTGQAGRLLGMQQGVPDGTPFTNFVMPGILLALAVGGSQIAAARGELRRARWAATASLLAGGVVMGWIVGEVALLGWIAPRGLQPFCFAYGELEVALALCWLPCRHLSHQPR